MASVYSSTFLHRNPFQHKSTEFHTLQTFPLQIADQLVHLHLVLLLHPNKLEDEYLAINVLHLLPIFFRQFAKVQYQEFSKLTNQSFANLLMMPPLVLTVLLMLSFPRQFLGLDGNSLVARSKSYSIYHSFFQHL